MNLFQILFIKQSKFIKHIFDFFLYTLNFLVNHSLFKRCTPYPFTRIFWYLQAHATLPSLEQHSRSSPYISSHIPWLIRLRTGPAYGSDASQGDCEQWTLCSVWRNMGKSTPGIPDCLTQSFCTVNRLSFWKRQNCSHLKVRPSLAKHRDVLGCLLWVWNKKKRWTGRVNMKMCYIDCRRQKYYCIFYI